MPQISIVIITKNEAQNIVDCIISAKKISDNIVVVDSGSTDDTALLAEQHGAIVDKFQWRGYGHARNRGANLAKYEWILALDADERVSDELAAEINCLNLGDTSCIYGFHRKNFFGIKKIKFGSLAHDRVFRLYHRNYACWNLVPVHERLEGKRFQYHTLNAFVLHYGIRTSAHYYEKRMVYAYLCAIKYKQDKKRFIAALCLFSPLFNFIKSYFFQLGFLDKRVGFIVARINAQYTAKKYLQLYSMLQEEKKKNYSADLLKTSLRWINSFLS